MKPRIAQRAAVYAVAPGQTKREATELTLRMCPLFRASIPGRNAWVTKKAAKYGTAIICTASAGLVSSTNFHWPDPALLTTTSGVPRSAVMRRPTRATASASVRSTA